MNRVLTAWKFGGIVAVIKVVRRSFLPTTWWYIRRWYRLCTPWIKRPSLSDCGAAFIVDMMQRQSFASAILQHKER